MRRIIYAWDYVEWGGAQIHFLALIKEARKSFETIVVLPDGTDPQFLGFLDSEGIQYETFTGHVDAKPRTTVVSKIRRHWIRAKAEYSMLRTVERAGIDAVVHTDILPGQSLLSLIWLCLRTNVFLTLHNALPPVSRWRWALWKFKFGVISRFDNFHVFCTNEHAAKYFRQLFSKRVADDIKITYDSIDPTQIDDALEAPFDKAAVLERLGLPTDRFLILSLGQFIDRKGRWIFLKAAKSIADTVDEVDFVWVSPSLPNQTDSKRIKSFGLGERFHLIESKLLGKERQDVLKFLRVADLFVLPSFVEGVPIALLEAMGMGVPCVSTNVYGIPEAIENGETGMLVDAGDARALSETVLQLIRDKNLRRELALRGRQIAVTKFDERLAATTAVSAYKSALDFDS